MGDERSDAGSAPPDVEAVRGTADRCIDLRLKPDQVPPPDPLTQPPPKRDSRWSPLGETAKKVFGHHPTEPPSRAKVAEEREEASKKEDERIGPVRTDPGRTYKANAPKVSRNDLPKPKKKGPAEAAPRPDPSAVIPRAQEPPLGPISARYLNPCGTGLVPLRSKPSQLGSRGIDVVAPPPAPVADPERPRYHSTVRGQRPGPPPLIPPPSPQARPADPPVAPARPTQVDRGLQLKPVTFQAPKARQKPRDAVRTGHYPYEGPASEVIQTKQTIKKASGGNTWILAIAMEETPNLRSDYWLGDVYPAVASITEPQLNVPPKGASPMSKNLKITRPLTVLDYIHQSKTGDAANYGIYKMNWFMIRQTFTGTKLIGKTRAALAAKGGKPTDDQIAAQVGGEINSEVELATQILLEAMAKWDTASPEGTNPHPNNFWAGHRWGSDGLYYPSVEQWKDISRYYRGIKLIKESCDGDRSVWENNLRYWADVPAI